MEHHASLPPYGNDFYRKFILPKELNNSLTFRYWEIALLSGRTA
jgi:hypothetical protein